MGFLTDTALDSGALNARIRSTATADAGNLLTANQANPATVGGWDSVANASESAPGVFVATSATIRANVFTGLIGVIGPRETVTVYARVSCVGRGNSLRLRWRDASNADLRNDYSAVVPAGTVNGTVMLTATAPDNAANILVYPVYSEGGAVGDTITVHEAGFWRGARGIWQPPGRPIPSQSFVRTNGSYDMSGTGSPEAVITAPVGSTYTQTDATSVSLGGTLVWRKRTGTGSTGWERVMEVHAPTQQGQLLVSDPANDRSMQWASVAPLRVTTPSATRLIIPGESYGSITPNSSRWLGSPVIINEPTTIYAYHIEVLTNTSTVERRVGVGLYQMTPTGWALVPGSTVGGGSDSAANWPTIAVGETGIKVLTLTTPLAITTPGIYLPVVLHAYQQANISFRGVASNSLMAHLGTRGFDLSAPAPGGFNVYTGSVVWASTVDFQQSTSYAAPTAVGIQRAV